MSSRNRGYVNARNRGILLLFLWLLKAISYPFKVTRMKSARIALSTAIAAAVVFSGNGLAGTYKWVDSEGKTHYGDRPPPGARAQKLELRSKSHVEAEQKLRDLVERSNRAVEARLEKRRRAASEKANRDGLQAARAEECSTLRRNLDVFENVSGAYRPGAAGTDDRHYLSDEERKAEIQKVRSQIAERCGDPDDAAAQEQAREARINAKRCKAEREGLEKLLKSKRSTKSDIAFQREAIAVFCEGATPSNLRY